ncbi:MAG: hypothetical protein WCI51_21360, partial [Lentisphaerota bacterium]
RQKRPRNFSCVMEPLNLTGFAKYSEVILGAAKEYCKYRACDSLSQAGRLRYSKQHRRCDIFPDIQATKTLSSPILAKTLLLALRMQSGITSCGNCHLDADKSHVKRVSKL